MRAAYVTFRIDQPDGSYSESKIMMPIDVAESLYGEVLQWNKRWVTTFDEHDKYREDEEKYRKQLLAGHEKESKKD